MLPRTNLNVKQLITEERSLLSVAVVAVCLLVCLLVLQQTLGNCFTKTLEIHTHQETWTRIAIQTDRFPHSSTPPHLASPQRPVPLHVSFAAVLPVVLEARRWPHNVPAVEHAPLSGAEPVRHCEKLLENSAVPFRSQSFRTLGTAAHCRALGR